MSTLLNKLRQDFKEAEAKYGLTLREVVVPDSVYKDLLKELRELPYSAPRPDLTRVEQGFRLDGVRVISQEMQNIYGILIDAFREVSGREQSNTEK